MSFDFRLFGTPPYAEMREFVICSLTLGLIYISSVTFRMFLLDVFCIWLKLIIGVFTSILDSIK